MSMEYGFYNGPDREYDAEQMSRIFDGLINDGVYATLGDHLIVTANPDDTDSVIVGTGRAWFNHTWTYVYTAETMKGPAPDIVKDRIDAIVIDIDKDTRVNKLLWLTGTAGSTSGPTLINTETHHQHPLCYITRTGGNSSYISQSQITNKVGTSECPFVTGIIDTVDTDDLIQQWETQWETFVSNKDTSFTEWFENVKGILDEDTAGNLLAKIEALETKIGNLALVPTTKRSVSRIDIPLYNRYELIDIVLVRPFILKTSFPDSFPSLSYNKTYTLLAINIVVKYNGALISNLVYDALNVYLEPLSGQGDAIGLKSRYNIHLSNKSVLSETALYPLKLYFSSPNNNTYLTILEYDILTDGHIYTAKEPLIPRSSASSDVPDNMPWIKDVYYTVGPGASPGQTAGKWVEVSSSQQREIEVISRKVAVT